jgi:hypothetical protein
MRSLRLFIMVALVCGFFASTALARNVQVTIANKTGKTMNYLYISETGVNSWEDDILGVEYLGIRTLEHGYHCEFLMDDGPTWDLRAEFRGGGYQEYYGIDFKSCTHITLNASNATCE